MGLEVTELFESTPPASGSPSARRVAATEEADAGGTVVATAAAVEIGDWERGAGGAGGGAPASGSGFTATASVGSSGKAAMLVRPTASPPLLLSRVFATVRAYPPSDNLRGSRKRLPLALRQFRFMELKGKEIFH